MTAYRIDIRPRAPLRRGLHATARKSGAVAHSDTLHAALIAVAAASGIQDNTLERLRQLRLTSLFPALGKTPFFPKPYLPLPERGEGRAEGEQDDPKRWKKARLVSRAVLDAWLAGDPKVHDARIHDGVTLMPGEPGRDRWPKDGLLREARHTGVVVGRENPQATPYERNLLWLNTDAGARLWCLVDIDKDDADWIVECFERLGWAGLGGDRSSGLGGFELDGCAPLDPPVPSQGDLFMTMSLYLPTREEVHKGVLEPPAAYDCAARGGWIHGIAGTGFQKRAIRCCLEGSVFNRVAPECGEARDVRREHGGLPAWRSGLAFQWPFPKPAAKEMRP